MNTPIREPVQLKQYYGHKKPYMPSFPQANEEEHADLIHRQNNNVSRAKNLDFSFFQLLDQTISVNMAVI